MTSRVTAKDFIDAEKEKYRAEETARILRENNEREKAARREADAIKDRYIGVLKNFKCPWMQQFIRSTTAEFAEFEIPDHRDIRLVTSKNDRAYSYYWTFRNDSGTYVVVGSLGEVLHKAEERISFYRPHGDT